MEPSKRIVVNTVAQYSRTVINILISLYSTRVVLDVLDVNDFGVYNVVAGLITLMEFVKDSLIITTQRYISYYRGKGVMEEVRKIFSNSFVIHLVFVLLLALFLLVFKEPLIHNFLKIQADRIGAAEKVYDIVIITLSITVMTAPFKALFIARENIVYISAVEVAYALLKLAMVLTLAFFLLDKLLVYAWMNTALVSFSLLAFAIYALKKYPECSLKKMVSDVSRQYISQLLGFAGWTTFGSLTVALRVQGLGIVLNHFFGTVVNAAYGVTAQVFTALSILSSAIMNAMNPQIIKAEGEGDRKKMVFLVEKECKFSSLLIILFAIPIVVNIHEILSFWLKEIPAYTETLCQFILIAFMCDQLTLGLHVAKQSIGKIGAYTVLFYTPKVLILPVAYWILNEGGSLTTVMWVYLIIEIIMAVLRIPYMKFDMNLNVGQFLKNAISPLLPVILVNLLVSLALHQWVCFKYAFFVNIALAMLLSVAVIWLITLDREEKVFTTTLFSKLKHRNHG